MKITAQTLPIYAGVGALLLVGLWIAKRGFGGAAFDAASTAVSVAGGAVGGVAVGLGQQVGIPETDANQCQIDLQNGDILGGALSSCTLGELVSF